MIVLRTDGNEDRFPFLLNDGQGWSTHLYEIGLAGELLILSAYLGAGEHADFVKYNDAAICRRVAMYSPREWTRVSGGWNVLVRRPSH